MGLFSCCFGGGTATSEEYGLLKVAPAAGWHQHGGSAPARAPAFGEGALRQEEWASRFKKQPPAPFEYDASLQPAATQQPPSSARTTAGSRGGWESEPAYVRERAAALAAAQAQAVGRKSGWGLPGLGASKTSPPHVPVEGTALDENSGNGSGGSQKPVDIFWHSSYESSAPASSAKPGRSRRSQRQSQTKPRKQGGDLLLPQAPAFGQGALTKWH